MALIFEPKKRFSKKVSWVVAEGWRKYLAEGIGTFTIVFAACGASAANQLSKGSVGLVGAALASGFAVMAMIYTLGHICGAHFNPAVTLAFTLSRHFPLRDVPGYFLGQITGASLAALIAKNLFGTQVIQPGVTVLALAANPIQALLMEVIISFFLMFVIMAVATDTRAVGQAAAIAIGVTVSFAILIAGPLSSASMNPARSFGPALVNWNWQDHWLYWLGPLVGASLGAFLYQLVRGQIDKPEVVSHKKG